MSTKAVIAPTVPPPSVPRPPPTPVTPPPSGTASSSSSSSTSSQSSKSTTTRGSTKSEVRYRTTKIQETVYHTLTDNGAGEFGDNGLVDYAAKSINVRLVSLDSTTDGYKSDHEDAKSFEQSNESSSSSSGPGGGSSSSSGSSNSNSSTQKGGAYLDNAVSEQLLASSTLRVNYATGSGAEVTNTAAYRPAEITIDLCPLTSDYVVPGSVMFTWMGQVFSDFDGILWRGRTGSDPGLRAGLMNYSTGIATVTDYVVSGSPSSFTLQSLWTIRQAWNTASVFFRTEAAPIKPSGLVMSIVDSQGNNLTASSQLDGSITGEHLHGTIEYPTGEAAIQFGDYLLDSALTPEQKAEWWYDPADVGAVQPGKIWRPWPVDPTTLRYSAVSYIYLPVDVSLMGIDPAALPPDGRVPFARPGDTCVVGLTHGGAAFAPSVGMTYDTGHQRLSFVQVLDSVTGEEIRTGYTHDLDAGTLTFTDVAAYPSQVKVVARTEVYRQIAEVRIDGKVRLTQPIGYAFPVGAVFSTALRQGDRFARVTRVYDQASWNKVKWTDGIDPTVGEAPATYNTTGSPIEVSNRGAITERWALHFKTSTTFDLYGQHLGLIASGSINEDFAPVNVAAGVPYFTLRALGWGGGWAAGNAVFLDTVGAEFPIDLVRTVQPSSPAGIDDNFWLVQRGDVGRPPESGF